MVGRDSPSVPRASDLLMRLSDRLSDETARVEDALSRPSSLEALYEMFATAKASAFENLLDPMLKVRNAWLFS